MLVIGSGPAGIAAAGALKAEGVSFDWVDREGVIGGAYARMYPKLLLSSPTRFNRLLGRAPRAGEYMSAAEEKVFLAGLCAELAISPRREGVSSVARAAGGFEVRFESGEARAYRFVVAATGMFEFPNLRTYPEQESAGVDARHARDWDGPERYRGKKLLIVGAGMTGIELAEEAARAGVPSALSARRPPKLIPQKFLGLDLHYWAAPWGNLPGFFFRSYCRRWPAIPGTDLGFKAFARAGTIRVLPEFTGFSGRDALFSDGKKERFDALVFATGYRYAAGYLPPDVAREPAGHPAARRNESVSWPGLFLIGFPCAGRIESAFLRGAALDAPPLARRIKARLAGA